MSGLWGWQPTIALLRDGKHALLSLTVSKFTPSNRSKSEEDPTIIS